MAKGGATVAVVGTGVADYSQRTKLPVGTWISAETAAARAVHACAAYDWTVWITQTQLVDPSHVTDPGTEVCFVATTARASTVNARAVADTVTFVVKMATFANLT